MVKYLIDESALIELQEKFEHARTLFDVLQDEVEHEARALNLATIGLFLTFDAAQAVGKLIDDAQARAEVRRG